MVATALAGLGQASPLLTNNVGDIGSQGA